MSNIKVTRNKHRPINLSLHVFPSQNFTQNLQYNQVPYKKNLRMKLQPNNSELSLVINRSKKFQIGHTRNLSVQ